MAIFRRRREMRDALAERERRETELHFMDIAAEKTRCVECGGQQTAEMGLNGPYVFCVECGAGSPERS